jgi:uncharacterized protein (TIGR00730 family)
VRRDLGLVCGGSTGMMSSVVEAVRAESRDVICVVPSEAWTAELDRYDVAEVVEVRTVDERIALMVDLSDAFVALPGGLRTLGELLEVLTWAQLGFHSKPIGILDSIGYFSPLFALLGRTATDGLPAPLELLHRESDPARLLARLSDAWSGSAPAPQFRESIRAPGLVAVLSNVVEPPHADDAVDGNIGRTPDAALAQRA